MQLRTRIDDSAQDMTVEALANIYTPNYRMMSVVREYVSNALDAQRDAGCEAPVSLDIRDDSQRLTITVEDQGVGMDRETLERVYVHISLSGKRSSADAIGGFGIGAKAAHSLGGTLMVTSDTGTVAHRLLSTRDTVTGGIVNELTEIASTGKSGTTVVVDAASVTPGPLALFLTLLSLTSRVSITGDYAPVHQYRDSGVFRTGNLASEVAGRLGVAESRLFAVPAGVPDFWLSYFDIVAGVPVPTRYSSVDPRSHYSPSLRDLSSGDFRPGVLLAADVSSGYALPRSREALLSSTTGEQVTDATTTRVSSTDLAALSDIAERELGDLLHSEQGIDSREYDRWSPQDRVILASILAAMDNADGVVVYRARKPESSRYDSDRDSGTDTGKIVEGGLPLPRTTAAVLERTPRMARPSATKSVPPRIREAVLASTLPDSSDTLIIDAVDPADRQRAAVAVGLMYLGTPAVVTRPASRSRSAAKFTAYRVGGCGETRTVEEWVSLLDSGTILGGSTNEFKASSVRVQATAVMGDFRVEAAYSSNLVGGSGEVYANLPGSLPLYWFASAPSAVSRAYRQRIDQTRKTVRQAAARSGMFRIAGADVSQALSAQIWNCMGKEGLIDAAVIQSSHRLAEPHVHQGLASLVHTSSSASVYGSSVSLLRGGSRVCPRVYIDNAPSGGHMLSVVSSISHAVRYGGLSAASAREVLEAVLGSDPDDPGISFSEACRLLDGLVTGDIPLEQKVHVVD